MYVYKYVRKYVILYICVCMCVCVCAYVCMYTDLQVSVFITKGKHIVVYTICNLTKMAVL